MTCSPFFSVNRWTGGSASSPGLGGAGERIRSLRPAQYSTFGLPFGAPGTFSYWTCTDAGGVAGGAGGGDDAHPPSRREIATCLAVFISSSPPVAPVARAAPASRA